VLHRWKQTL